MGRASEEGEVAGDGSMSGTSKSTLATPSLAKIKVLDV